MVQMQGDIGILVVFYVQTALIAIEAVKIYRMYDAK